MLPTVVALAVPTMLEQLMHTAVQYIDTAMVGSLGTQASAAVGSTSTVGWLVGSSLSALGVGFLSFIARANGAGDKALCRRASAQAVLAVLVSGILFTILTLSLSPVVPVLMQVDPDIRDTTSTYFFILYTPMLFRAASIIFGAVLRGAGDTKTPMRAGIIVNVVNVVLNFFLIYPTRTVELPWFSDGILLVTIRGAGLGVVGAALASAIAFAVGGVVMTVTLWRHPLVSPRGQRFRPDREVLFPCLKVAMPNMAQRFATSLGYVVFASMINSLGDVSTAAHNFANTVESAFYIPGYGMQAAAATLAGNCVGAKDKNRLDDLGRLMLFCEVLLMIASGGLLFLLAPYMLRLFSSDPAVIDLATIVLRMVAVSEPFYGVTIITEGMMQGVGNTKTPFVFNVIGMWGLRIFGTLLCTLLAPEMSLVYAWACMIAHNLALFCMFSVYYKKGKWSPLHTQPPG
ncbi:MAG: MATE family efflux transporter [Ruminococcaceae bacterium]|nr:MATE family efflux transporter [Oscillospiraceae bacterium]